jgi:hypothetical protein
MRTRIQQKFIKLMMMVATHSTIVTAHLMLLIVLPQQIKMKVNAHMLTVQLIIAIMKEIHKKQKFFII